MNKVTLFFFATFRVKAGVKEATLDVPDGATVAQLRGLVAEKFPELADSIYIALVAVNKDYAADEVLIPEGAEIAMFPPVSGGSQPPTIFAVTNDELDLDDLLKKITLPSTGAAAIFTGMVRGKTKRDDPHETEYLEYEAYQEMAEDKMAQVAEEIRAKWPTIEGIAVVQRIGKLFPGTPTVLIACTAAHRDTGVFEAARYGIDRLKQIVPIWKKEVGPGGEVWIEGDYIPQPGE